MCWGQVRPATDECVLLFREIDFAFLLTRLFVEVVLSTLVENFTFAPGSKEIIWQLNGVIQPTTKDAGITSTGHRQLQLPLKLSCIEAED